MRLCNTSFFHLTNSQNHVKRYLIHVIGNKISTTPATMNPKTEIECRYTNFLDHTFVLYLKATSNLYLNSEEKIKNKDFSIFLYLSNELKSFI